MLTKIIKFVSLEYWAEIYFPADSLESIGAQGCMPHSPNSSFCASCRACSYNLKPRPAHLQLHVLALNNESRLGPQPHGGAPVTCCRSSLKVCAKAGAQLTRGYRSTCRPLKVARVGGATSAPTNRSILQGQRLVSRLGLGFWLGPWVRVKVRAGAGVGSGLGLRTRVPER